MMMMRYYKAVTSSRVFPSAIVILRTQTVTSHAKMLLSKKCLEIILHHLTVVSKTLLKI